MRSGNRQIVSPYWLVVLAITCVCPARGQAAEAEGFQPPSRPAEQFYRDVPFAQERATIYLPELSLDEYTLRTVRVDRDGKLLINTDRGLLKGYEGRIVPFRDYAGLAGQVHHDVELLEGKFVFLNSRMLLPLHGAGRDFYDNRQRGFSSVAALGPAHYVLLSPNQIVELQAGNETTQLANTGYQHAVALPASKSAVLWGPKQLAVFAAGKLTPLQAPEADIVGVADEKPESQQVSLLVATSQGLYRVTTDGSARIERKLPVNELTCIARDDQGRVWLGSPKGAFSFVGDERANYYAGRRWLANDHVIDITIDPQGDVYILNAGGLTKLRFEQMALADKAAIYQQNLRLNHIRFGLVSDVNIPGGDYAKLQLHDTDNDGLWSSMYLAAESYRYAVTGAEDALQNALDGFDALERLLTINPIPGFQARTFELDGFKVSDKERWRKRDEEDFEWKGHTSSDELVGTFFCYAVMWDTIGQGRPELRARIAALVDKTMSHILDNNLYLIDIDGKPTLWGRWNPEYVNTDMVGGDRRLNSIEILAFLQLAFHFTGKERFRDAFLELVNDHGYAENTVRYLPDPRGPWNHSDDELYWLSYYNLLRNIFEPNLRATFFKSAQEHVEATKRKRNPVWNFIYGGATGEAIDLEGSATILREFPLDMRRWRMTNSHREDIELLPRPRRRGRESVEVLPPDERAVTKWNSNEMSVDGGGSGESAESGAEFLLPYWMGRYFGYISSPERSASVN